MRNRIESAEDGSAVVEDGNAICGSDHASTGAPDQPPMCLALRLLGTGHWRAVTPNISDRHEKTPAHAVRAAANGKPGGAPTRRVGRDRTTREAHG